MRGEGGGQGRVQSCAGITPADQQILCTLDRVDGDSIDFITVLPKKVRNFGAKAYPGGGILKTAPARHMIAK